MMLPPVKASRTATVIKALLIISVVLLPFVAPPQVSAETCGSGTGVCRIQCLPGEISFVGQGSCSSADELCCAQNGAIDSCTETCMGATGCTCPSNCVRQSVAPRQTCGGVATVVNQGEVNVFGSINKPVGVERFGGAGEIGLLAFISLLIKIFSVIAGLLTFFNFIIAGYTYLTAEGNPKAHEEVKNRLTYSIIGIVLIVSAYTITALISLIFFGNASFILNPTIAAPGSGAP
jgi:hypothetical protein